ncbi:Oxidoreductase NAD-binding domain protein [Verrucomicrobiia bacterium DG1235]|nr:Oxidoreductase NAD-binding domain protein [Verrucomicrobiae bacterium DG1235]
MNLASYDISHPYIATVEKTDRITDENTAEVRHITLTVPDPTFQYIEGQSIGILAPVPRDFGNKHHMRLYSIASSRKEGRQTKIELEICVRRCFYIDEVSGERYPGVASNYLCDLKPGDSLKITGPYGRHFLPPNDPSSNIVMIGVGTGIAPYRAFMKHIYENNKSWKGTVRLYYGAQTGMDLLYLNDKNSDISNYYDEETFKAFQSLSSKPYLNESDEIEESLAENASEIWDLLQDPKTHVYVSGLSQLKSNLDDALSKFADSEEAWIKHRLTMKEEGRWSTLFYN